jgi:hypothetical protein
MVHGRAPGQGTEPPTLPSGTGWPRPVYQSWTPHTLPLGPVAGSGPFHRLVSMPDSMIRPCCRAWRRVLPALLAVALVPATTAAQSVTVDQGTFRILSEGQDAGTEEFAIRRAGSGADQQVIATAEIRLTLPDGSTSLVPLLRTTGGDMAVSAYQIKVSGNVQEEVVMELGGGRYVSRVRSERGEREREYRAATGTVLLDRGVAHQYHFLALRAADGNATVPAISPREGRQFELTVSTVSAATSVQLGEGSTQARHLRVEGDGRTVELWVDAEHRVLRVEDPERGYTAIRTRAP